MKHHVLILLLIGWIATGWCQEPSTDSVKVYPLNEVVITATRTQIPLRDSPSEVDIINRSLIEGANGSTVADVLENSGGVFVKEYGANAALKTLSLRGSASEHVLVLVNGNRFNNFQNDLVDLSLLPLDGVERIEIVHGGNSALYGADALGGVVNILTKRASAEARIHTEVSGGSFGYERYLVSGQGRLGSLGLSMGYGSERGRDDFTYASSGVPGGTAKRGNSDFVRRQFFLNGDAAIDDRSSLTVSLQEVHADRGAPGAIGPFESELARQNDHDVNVIASYSDAHLDRLNLSVRSAVHYNYETFIDPNPFFPLDSYYKNVYANLNPQAQYLLGASEKIVAGIDIGQGTLDGNDFDSKITRVQKAVYLASETHLDFQRDVFDRFSLFGTLRYDHVTDVDQAFTPKLGLNVRLMQAGDLRLRFSGGRNFRPPTFNDLYYRGFSNPSLKPEYSTSLDAGFSTSIVLADVESIIDITYFFLDTKDRIYFDLRTFRPENIGRVESRGWEMKYTGRLLPSLLTAGVSYTLTNAIKKNPTMENDQTIGNQLPFVPRGQFNASLSGNLEPFTLNLFYSIVGGRFTDETNAEELPPYRLANANIGIHQTIDAWQFLLKGEVNNIFDEEYEIFKNYPMPKNNYRITISVEYAR